MIKGTISVIDKQNYDNIIGIYTTVKEVSQVLDMPQGWVSKAMKTGSLIKGRYSIMNVEKEGKVL